MTPLQAFADQARACRALGSYFTALVLEVTAEALGSGSEVGRLVLSWQGDPSSSADSVPLRLAGGLHALILTGREPALAELYPPGGTADPAALRTEISAVLERQSKFLKDWMTSAPQTNETGRSVALVPAGRLIAARLGLPLRLLELGTSAGLNLRWDMVGLETGSWRVGPADAPIVLRPDWTGEMPETAEIAVASREGVDLKPLDPANAQDRLRLLSYVWPDQPERLERMKVSLELAARVPAAITRGDAADWLRNKLPRSSSTRSPGSISRRRRRRPARA